MYHLSIDAAWQLGKDKQQRYLAEADRRRRRIRPRPPRDLLPGPDGPQAA